MTKSRSRVALAMVAGAVGVSLVLAACSSSSTSTSDGGGGSSSGGTKEPIKIGVLGSFTGAAAPGYVGSREGVEARVKAFNDAGGLDGRMIEMVEGDDASSVDGNLSAVKRLIDQENVFAILDNSPFFFGGYRYALQQMVPVMGTPASGAQYSDPANVNLFSFNGAGYVPVPATSGMGEFMKAKGVTALGVAGYGQSEASVQGALNGAKSAEAAGLSAPYQNTSIPFGSVDFGAVALAMKEKGVDAMFSATTVQSSIALYKAMTGAGINVKVAFFPTGYGKDLLADKPTAQAAEGGYFSSGIAPFEMNTPGTEEMKKNFEATGYVGDPSYPAAKGYLEADLLIKGLQLIGPDGTKDDFITEVRQMKYDGAGVVGDPSKVIDMSQVPGESPPGNCGYILQLKNGAFELVDGYTPQCSTLIK